MANKETPTEEPAQPVEMTKGRPSLWVRFVLIIAAVLAVDLGLKAWSFENVADTPIKVRTAEGGGPEVLVRFAEDKDWASAVGLGLTEHPSVVPRHEPVDVVPGLLKFQLTLNTGAVFGTGQGGRPIFIAVSVIAVAVIILLMVRSPAKATAYHIGLALILGGALGNLYDRIRFSAVRDMLYMLPETGLWPWIFNPADVALVFGVGLVLVVSYLGERKAAKTDPASAKK